MATTGARSRTTVRGCRPFGDRAAVEEDPRPDQVACEAATPQRGGAVRRMHQRRAPRKRGEHVPETGATGSAPSKRVRVRTVEVGEDALPPRSAARAAARFRDQVPVVPAEARPRHPGVDLHVKGAIRPRQPDAGAPPGRRWPDAGPARRDSIRVLAVKRAEHHDGAAHPGLAEGRPLFGRGHAEAPRVQPLRARAHRSTAPSRSRWL